MVGFEQRRYRLDCGPGDLVPFTARVKETDLWILAEQDLAEQAVESIMNHRRGLEAYLAEKPQAASALTPLEDDPLAPAMMRAMLAAGRQAGTGPMAAVAGAIAEAVARDLAAHSATLVVENGGDLFLMGAAPMTVAIGAGDSPLSGKVGLHIPAEHLPLAIGTSSATVGHSLSLGKADAATVLADSGALADACATALGNAAGSQPDMAGALEWVSTVEGVSGALVILGKHLAAWGEITLINLEESAAT